jgi:glycogen synthase
MTRLQKTSVQARQTPHKIVYLTYETPFAPCGGIAAVAARLPEYLKAASACETIVLTPYHYKIEKTRSLSAESQGRFPIMRDGRALWIELLSYRDRVDWYFLRPEDPAFFAGERHPYDVARRTEGVAARLLEDSLVFGASVGRALHLIDANAIWHVLIQDWEAAVAALALAQEPHTHKLYLTLHNSYDTALEDADLRRVGIDPSLCPGETVLERALGVAGDCVLTVSEQFALDLTHDLLQSRIMIPHLAAVLEPRLVGINNGPFTRLQVDPQVVERAKKGDFGPFKAWKEACRAEALKAMADLHTWNAGPVWSDLTAFRRDDAPWFLMAGRDDSRQKGYDLSAVAAEDLLASGTDARFLFFPIPGDEGYQGLTFLRDLADRFPEQIAVFPFIWHDGFSAVLQGATFGLMPSLYEPFGMANEFYLNGTAAIARATGGLAQQIAPRRDVPSFTPSASQIASTWHAPSAKATGLLYREPTEIESALDDWRIIVESAYLRRENAADRLSERIELPLFRAMAASLRTALQDGVRLYTEDPEQYYRMLTAGIQHIERSLSWERSAQRYISAMELPQLQDPN